MIAGETGFNFKSSILSLLSVKGKEQCNGNAWQDCWKIGVFVKQCSCQPKDPADSWQYSCCQADPFACDYYFLIVLDLHIGYSKHSLSEAPFSVFSQFLNVFSYLRHSIFFCVDNCESQVSVTRISVRPDGSDGAIKTHRKDNKLPSDYTIRDIK